MSFIVFSRPNKNCLWWRPDNLPKADTVNHLIENIPNQCPAFRWKRSALCWCPHNRCSLSQEACWLWLDFNLCCSLFVRTSTWTFWNSSWLEKHKMLAFVFVVFFFFFCWASTWFGVKFAATFLRFCSPNISPPLDWDAIRPLSHSMRGSVRSTLIASASSINILISLPFLGTGSSKVSHDQVIRLWLFLQTGALLFQVLSEWQTKRMWIWVTNWLLDRASLLIWKSSFFLFLFFLNILTRFNVR